MLKPSLQKNVYVWTAFFYAVTKRVRDQKIVDNIYTQFLPSATKFLAKNDAPSKAIPIVQATYWKFRSILNKSGIDSRDSDGMHQLWELLLQQAYIDSSIPDDAFFKFVSNIVRLCNHTASEYELSPFDEIFYYMEAANGMTVRVPESKLEQWQEAQDRIRRGEHAEKSEISKQALDRVLQRLYQPEDSGET